MIRKIQQEVVWMLYPMIYILIIVIVFIIGIKALLI